MFENPQDGNFTDWKPDMQEKIDGACGGDWLFHHTGMNWGQSIFGYQRESDKEDYLLLEDVLRKVGRSDANQQDDDLSVGYYLRKTKRNEIVFLTFGLLIFFLSIFYIFFIYKKFHNFIKRKFMRKSKKEREQIRRLNSVQPKFRSALITYSSINSLVMILLGVFLFLGAIQSLKGIKTTNCNAWLQFYGHYFGTSDFERGPEAVAWNWMGTDQIQRMLAEIEPKVTPGSQGQVYQDMMEGYKILQANADQVTKEINATAESMTELIKVWNSITSHAQDVKYQLMNTTYLKAPIATGSNDVAGAKTKKLTAELQTTMDAGWAGIESLIQKYTGTESPLMNLALNSVKYTQQTLIQVDHVIAELVRFWNDHIKLLKGLVVFAATIVILLALVVIGNAVLSAVLALWLLQRLRHDHPVPARERHMWAWAYGLAVGCVGVGALLSCIFFLVSQVGKDVCAVLEDGLFQRGDWEVIPEKIRKPDSPMLVDVNVLFDTCIQRDGAGDIAVALALDGRIAELSDEVRKAQEDVHATQNALMPYAEKKVKIQILKLAYEEMHQLIFRKNVAPSTGWETDSDVFSGYFNDTRMVAIHSKDETREGPPRLLCVVPRISNAISALYDCYLNGLATTLTNHNTALDVLQEVMAEAQRRGVDPAMPKGFCTQLAQDSGYQCPPDGLIIKDYLNAWDIDKWTGYIREVFPDSEEWRGGKNTANRFANLLSQLRDLEDYGQVSLRGALGNPAEPLQGPLPAGAQCPNSADDCTIDEARRVALSVSRAAGQSLLDDIEQIFSFVNDYVTNKVDATMQSLVVDANDITAGSNCQFEGTALHEGVVVPACSVVFPAFSFLALITGLTGLGALLLSVHHWKWYSYLRSLGAFYQDNPELYEKREGSLTTTPFRYLSDHERAKVYSTKGVSTDEAPRQLESPDTATSPLGTSPLGTSPLGISPLGTSPVHDSPLAEVSLSTGAQSSPYAPTYPSPLMGRNLPVEPVGRSDTPIKLDPLPQTSPVRQVSRRRPENSPMTDSSGYLSPKVSPESTRR